MLRRSFRIGLTLGLLGGLAFALFKLLGSRRASAPEARPIGAPSSWPPLQPEPAPTFSATTALVPDPEAPVAKKAAAPKKATPAKADTAWVEPSGDVCPTTHPVKAKLSSKIFHLPGMLNYNRTKPDRCYRDAPSAEGDGLRPAKR